MKRLRDENDDEIDKTKVKNPNDKKVKKLDQYHLMNY